MCRYRAYEMCEKELYLPYLSKFVINADTAIFAVSLESLQRVEWRQT